MTKLVRLDPRYWPLDDFGSGHEVAVTKPNVSGARWTFDGNAQRPTFAPSINLKINTPDMGKDYRPDRPSTVCHHFIRDGRIQFLADCTHALRGKTVDLPDIPAGRYLSCEPVRT